ncbi:MAG: glycosyltransferase family 2 protein [Thermoplasmata archaeon]
MTYNRSEVTSTGSTPAPGAIKTGAGKPRADPPEVVVILPTLNEVANLRRTLESIPLADLKARGWRVTPIVIDGGSTDGTVDEARKLGLPVLRQQGKGKGLAIREALRYSQNEGMRFAIVIDADCTYPGEAVLSLLSLLDSGSDLVVGVRQNFRKPKGTKEFVHRIGNALLTYVASQLGRDLILDLCSGFWGVDLTTWSDDGLRSTGFEIESELFLKALLSGFSVAQIPIPYRARAKGAKLRTVHDGSRILLSILSSMRFRRGLGGGPRQSESSLIRSVLAVCFIQGSGRLLVLADSTRVKEAKLLTQRLNAGGIDAQVELLAPKAGADPKELMDSMVQRSSEQGTPVVALTGSPGTTKSDSTRVVMIPNTQRVIALGLEGPTGLPAMGKKIMMAVDRSGATTGGFSLVSQHPAERPVHAFRSLGAALDGTSVQDQVRFLGANQIGLPVSVFRVDGSGSESNSSTPSSRGRSREK